MFEIDYGGSGLIGGIAIFFAVGLVAIVAVFAFGLFREVKEGVDEEEEDAKAHPDNLV